MTEGKPNDNILSEEIMDQINANTPEDRVIMECDICKEDLEHVRFQIVESDYDGFPKEFRFWVCTQCLYSSELIEGKRIHIDLDQ